ncbi:unnamed protein product [Thelazia callipaeda]|uniref:C-type lectin domain-containing protein n=1 Tax=Thelazia callipaeda TaxID=103827 RepID=A0A0N5D3J8_THECL|nr:unnamed protein product [Thelazia callipaeda]
MTWMEAEKKCNELGGHLASVADEYEDQFVSDVGRSANLSIPTIWLGQLTKVDDNEFCIWNDGTSGVYLHEFKVPKGFAICMSLWVDWYGAEGSWNDWSCDYPAGFSALCKRKWRSQGNPGTETSTVQGIISLTAYSSRRCCAVSTKCAGEGQNLSCLEGEHCVPDDQDCETQNCPSTGLGWCLPAPSA